MKRFLPLLALLLAAPAFAQETPIYCVTATSVMCDTTSNPGNHYQGDSAWLAFGKLNAWGTQLGLFSNQPANEVAATPSGTTGILSVRALVGADIPPINLAGGNANGGVTGILPIADGGTGLSTVTANDCLAGNSGGTALTYVACGSGGGSPGGSSGQLQYNNAGAFGGFTLAGDCTFSEPNITCTKTGGVSFGTFATANAASPPAIGGTTPAAGAFTTLSASSTVSGTGFSTYLASPPAIGGTAAAAGTFTTLTSTGATVLDGSTVPASGGTLAALGLTQTFTGTNTFAGIVDSGITTTPSTSPICPDGTGGAFTTTGCATASMVYPGAGIAVSTGTAWGTPINGGSNTIVGNAGSGQAPLTPQQALAVLVSTAPVSETASYTPTDTTNAYGEYSMGCSSACTFTVPPAPISAPTNGALTATAGGTLAATTYYVQSAWVTSSGQTVGATATSLAVAVDDVLNVAAPSSPPASATGWDVYVCQNSGASCTNETLQNTSPLGTTTAWVEPTTGLTTTGAATPTTNTSGVSFATDTTLTVSQSTASQATVTPGSGVTLEGAVYGASTTQTYALSENGYIQIQALGSNTWRVLGWTPALQPTGGSYALSGTCTTSAHNGNASVGTITLSSAGPCTLILTFANVPPGVTGWTGSMGDLTQTAAGTFIPTWRASASSTNSITFSLPTAVASGDVVTYGPLGQY